MWRATLLAALIAAMSLTPPASASIQPEAIRQLAAGRAVEGEPLYGGKILLSFYQRRNFAPVWMADQQLSPRGQDALAQVAGAATEGLDPGDYHVAAITRMLARANGDDRALERAEVLLSDAVLLYATHLGSGRVDPRAVHPTWKLGRRKTDVIPALENALARGDLRGFFASLTPRSPGYARVRTALAALRAVEGRGGWNVVASARTPLKIGMRDARVIHLRNHLATTGDLALMQTSAPDLFDVNIETAVRRFQKRHAVHEDGVVGPETLRELNVPVRDRIRDLELTIERWRWLPDLGERFAVINIADQRLMLIDGRRVILEMRTVVGKEAQRTPIFSSRIEEVIINPYWNVPDSIAYKELLPKARRRPGFLAAEHIEWHDGRLRQKPGPWNSLGSLKFNLPNDFDVYLHDTPARTLFDEPLRAFSHGCIRLHDPLALALYLLRDQPQWTAEQIACVVATQKETRIKVTNPLPVHILYATAWTDDSGELQFRRDIYRRNPELIAAMRAKPARLQ